MDGKNPMDKIAMEKSDRIKPDGIKSQLNRSGLIPFNLRHPRQSRIAAPRHANSSTEPDRVTYSFVRRTDRVVDRTRGGGHNVGEHLWERVFHRLTCRVIRPLHAG